MRLIDQDGKQIGITSTADALQMAKDAGMDLVEVAPQARPPVCKIMDFGKFKYKFFDKCSNGVIRTNRTFPFFDFEYFCGNFDFYIFLNSNLAGKSVILADLFTGKF